MIILKSKYGDGGTYAFSQKDKKSWNEFSAAFLLEYYDFDTGKPLEKIKELDDCVNKKWNQEKFKQLWKELKLTSETDYFIE